jgi:hypothetical protein
MRIPRGLEVVFGVFVAIFLFGLAIGDYLGLSVSAYFRILFLSFLLFLLFLFSFYFLMGRSNQE